MNKQYRSGFVYAKLSDKGVRLYEQLGIAQEVTFAQALLASVVGA
ncbi:MAG: hypothetical protein ACOYNY_24390 [Caldilineaceae bacterium]